MIARLVQSSFTSSFLFFIINSFYALMVVSRTIMNCLCWARTTKTDTRLFITSKGNTELDVRFTTSIIHFSQQQNHMHTENCNYLRIVHCDDAPSFRNENSFDRKRTKIKFQLRPKTQERI